MNKLHVLKHELPLGMERATCMRAQILKDTGVQQIFGINIDEIPIMWLVSTMH